MFTGIVQGLGEITSRERQGGESRFAIRPLFVMPDIQLGESIAVNGACLSVEKSADGRFWAYASAETLSRTNLANLREGAKVNLERALALGERLGGHIVSGHIDCLARVRKITRAGQSLKIDVSFPDQYSGEVIIKGSVALDGISLTVNEAGMGALCVNVIPDTRRRTNMAQWRDGTVLNMETDIIGKYVRRLIGPYAGEKIGAPKTDGRRSGNERDSGRGVDLDILARNGFI